MRKLFLIAAAFGFAILANAQVQSTITLDMQKNLVIGALDYLDNDTLIYRYSWFTGRSGEGTPHIDLFEAEPGKLSELGEIYVHYSETFIRELFTSEIG